MDKELSFPQFVPLHIGYWEHHADWNFKNVNSPFMRLYLVMKGSAKVQMGNKERTLTPGHLYLIPPFTTHTDTCDGDFYLYYIHVFESMENRKYSLFERFSFPFEIVASSLDELLVKNLAEINTERKLVYSDPKKYDNQATLLRMITQNNMLGYSSYIETRGILLQLFSRFLLHASFSENTSNTRILNVQKYVRDHIESPIKIKTLSELCFLTEDHFIRLFKKEVGMTPLAYIQRKKIEKAQIMMVFNDMSVKDIAYALSYDNISYFIRLFKKISGSTPGEYKRHFV